MNLSRHLAVLITVATMAGCAVAPPSYVPPERAGNAVITVDLTKGGVVYYANGDNCSDAKIFAPEHNPILRADHSFVVPANRRIALQSLWSSGTSTCFVMTSMVLKPDATYVLSGRLEQDVCRVVFRDAKDPGASMASEVELTQVEWGWSTCHPQVKK